MKIFLAGNNGKNRIIRENNESIFSGGGRADIGSTLH